jgi:tetratricopeptide (TPR) repeat protein
LAALAGVALVLAVGLPLGGVWYAARERLRAEEANRQRDRAYRAEQQAHDLLAASYADTARLAMQRGDWSAALRYLDRALRAGYPDAADLQLAKVRAWFAGNEVPQGVGELEALARRRDLTNRQRALVLLWQGDVAISRSFTHAEEGLKLVRRAVARGLPAAEKEYARGLLADTTPEAVRHFERALAHDPFHPRANGALVLTLATLGRLPEARQRIHFAERVFPRDPTFRVLHALLEAIAGNRAHALRLLDEAGQRLQDGRQLDGPRLMVELLVEVRELKFWAGDPDQSFLDLAKKLAPLAPRFKAILAADQQRRPTRTRTALLLPGVPPKVVSTLLQALRPSLPGVDRAAGLQALRQAAALLTGGGPTLSLGLGRVVQVHPEGSFAYCHGMTLVAEKRWAEAEKAFLQAAETPAVFPVRRGALFLAVLCEWFLAEEPAPAGRPEAWERALANTRRLLSYGDPPPFQARALIVIALKRNDLDLARWLVAGWERQAPDDLEVVRQRMVIEFKGGAYERVGQTAEKVLRRQPKDELALRYRAEAKARLRQAKPAGK